MRELIIAKLEGYGKAAKPYAIGFVVGFIAGAWLL